MSLFSRFTPPPQESCQTSRFCCDCFACYESFCTAIASDHVNFTYTHPDSGAVVVNMQVEDYWGGDYAASTFYHDVELFTVPDPVFQACITAEMDAKNYTTISQITELSCNSQNLFSIEGVELLPSLVSLNIAGSSVSDLSPVLQSNSLLSLSLLDVNGTMSTIMDPDLTVFKQLIREHIACRRLYIPSCYDAIYVGDCPPPFFTDRCDNGTCDFPLYSEPNYLECLSSRYEGILLDKESDGIYRIGKSLLTNEPRYSFVVVEYDLDESAAPSGTVKHAIENHYNSFFISSKPHVPNEIPYFPPYKDEHLGCVGGNPTPPTIIMW